MKQENVLSVAKIQDGSNKLEVGRHSYDDVSDPHLIRSCNYRPIDESNIAAKMKSISVFGVVSPLTLIVDSERRVFCKDGDHRRFAVISLRENPTIKTESLTKLPVIVEVIDYEMEKYDLGPQTQLNAAIESIVDKALRYQRMRETRSLSTRDIAAMENVFEKTVERTLAILHFSPRLLEFVRLNAKFLPDKYIFTTAREFNKVRKSSEVDIQSLESNFLRKMTTELLQYQNPQNSSCKQSDQPKKKESKPKNIREFNKSLIKEGDTLPPLASHGIPTFYLTEDKLSSISDLLKGHGVPQPNVEAVINMFSAKKGAKI